MDRSLVRLGRWAAFLMAGASLAACASVAPAPHYAIRSGEAARPAPSAKGPQSYKTGEPYQVGGIWYVPHDQPDYDEKGTASWYGEAFNMKATANGELFDMNAFSAAHTTLPLPSLVEVTNLDNGRKLVVRVNDRGPFVGGRIIDLSWAAAHELGYDRAGLAHVRVRYVGPAPLAGPDAGMRVADATPMKPLPRAVAPSAPASAPARDDDVVLTSYKAPQAVAVTTLAAMPAAARPTVAAASTIAAPPAQIVSASARPMMSAAGSGFRIQAGAFSDQDRAQRAAAQLATAGAATVEPFQRNGETLYRVFLPGPADEVAAYGLRDKVAAAGFADARVVKPGAF